MFGEIITNISNFMLELGYVGIFFMMFLESSFFPFPSEVAMIPAGYFVGTGQMNLFLAFFSGTFGALSGAIINYFLGYFLGEKIILNLIRKYGKYFFIKEEGYNKTQKYFLENGSLATFTGRLIPVIRQLISIPAGIFKMDLKKFLFFTTLGAGLWNIILMGIGYFLYTIIGNVENISLIIDRAKPYLKEFTIYGLILVFVVILAYFMIKKYKKSGK